MANYNPSKILEYYRSDLIEQEHLGLLVKLSLNCNVLKFGDDNQYPFYIRSCAKPLQASLLLDLEIDKAYGMNIAEIAICCASHTGEPCHVNAVKSLLGKIGIDESYLKCGLHKPLSKVEQNKLLLSGEKENVLQNNCSGKHAMMLAICKKMNWDLKSYDELNHPLQIAIKSKIYELCELKIDYPVTKDGCGVPIYAMPLEKMLKGYLNLFISAKYSKIRDAIIANPYLIGGEGRLDTAIMSVNNKLIAKVGAGGLCIVVNLDKEEALIIKVMDCDMKARAITLIELLRQLNWLDKSMLESDLIKTQNNNDILTLHGEALGHAKCPSFNLS